MRVAAVQHDIVWEDPAANFARLAPMIADAAAAGAGLVALTEMYSTGFSPDTAKIAESVGGPSTGFLVDRAVAHGVWVCGSVPEQAEGSERPTNCLVLAGPGGELHRYAKVHPFRYAGEHERFASGSSHTMSCWTAATFIGPVPSGGRPPLRAPHGACRT